MILVSKFVDDYIEVLVFGINIFQRHKVINITDLILPLTSLLPLVRYHLNPVFLFEEVGADKVTSVNLTKVFCGVLNVSIVESIASIAITELSRTKLVNLEGSISNSL